MTSLLWPALVAAVVSMLLGYAWYGKALFGGTWLKIMGADKLSEAEMKKEQKDMGMTMGLQFLATLVTAFVLTGVLTLEPLGVGMAMKGAFVIWFGFMMPIQLGNALFSGKSKPMKKTMFLVSGGYQLISMLAMAAVITWLA